MSRALGLAAAILRNRRGRAGPPRLLTYIVSFACNARCVMCDSWRKRPKDELTLEEIDAIFAQLPRMDLVRLTGGEPFVRPDLGEVARIAQERLRPLALHVTTNGFLTDRILDFCRRRPRDVPLELLVSLDGVGEAHDRIRGRTYAWRRTVETLKALLPLREELRVNLLVNQTVIDEEGIEEYRRLREFLRPMGLRNNLVLAYESSATYSIGGPADFAPKRPGEYSTFGRFTREGMAELLREAESDLAAYPLLQRIAKRYYLRGVRGRLVEGRPTPNPRCVALNAHMRLYPDGTVPTCQFNSTPIGNVRDASFRDVWSGETARRQRAWVRACPGCWAECEVLPSALYTGDILARGIL